MASKNFCDICDKPAIGSVADVETPAATLNQADGPRSDRYQNNKMRVSVSWLIANTYMDTVRAGHICAECLVGLLNKHIEQIKRNGQS